MKSWDIKALKVNNKTVSSKQLAATADLLMQLSHVPKSSTS